MTVAIVDYGSGNLHSAAKAFERAASSFSWSHRIWRFFRFQEANERIILTSDPDDITTMARTPGRNLVVTRV